VFTNINLLRKWYALSLKSFHFLKNVFRVSSISIRRSSKYHTVKDYSKGPNIAFVRVLQITENLRRHKHWTTYYTFGLRKASSHSEINYFSFFLLAEIDHILQLKVAMIDSHLMQLSYSYKQIYPQTSGLFFAEFEFMSEHVIIEILTSLKVLSYDIVVRF
jgi:hypothetical protein